MQDINNILEQLLKQSKSLSGSNGKDAKNNEDFQYLKAMLVRGWRWSDTKAIDDSNAVIAVLKKEESTKEIRVSYKNQLRILELMENIMEEQK